MVKHRTDIALLDDAPRVHHRDAVGVACDDPQVVRDQYYGHAGFTPERVDQVEHLCLHGDVERRGRLVCDQHFRSEGDRHCDQHTLAHAAGELVREMPEAAPRIRNLHSLEQFDGLRRCVRAAHAPVGANHLDDLLADAEHRVESAQRILEDHRHHRSAAGAQLIRRESDQVALADQHRAGFDPSRPGHQAERREKCHAFAGARFADHRKYLARPHRQRDIVNDRYRTGGAGKAGAQPANLERETGRHSRRGIALQFGRR